MTSLPGPDPDEVVRGDGVAQAAGGAPDEVARPAAPEASSGAHLDGTSVPALLDLAAARFILLTTFRASGEPVATPVWVGRDGDALVVLTPAASGKVKRLRKNARVLVQPCGRFGAPRDGAPALAATARILERPEDVERARQVIRNAYPVESRVVLGIERLIERARGRSATPRLALHLR